MNPQRETIILIEGKQTDHPSFFLSLKKKGYDVRIASTGNLALEKMQSCVPMVVLIDAASLRTTSNRIVYRIKKNNPETPVILVIDETMKDKKISDKADIVLCLPFTIKKLINRIEFFQQKKPSTVSLQKIGNIEFDPENNRIFIENRPVALTPRVTKLLEIFLTKPGETIKREELYQKLWDTTYFDDMRSLDVHIRWLRQAIEKDPKKPEIIRTVKGQGYSLTWEE